jgi:hypothetical protein
MLGIEPLYPNPKSAFEGFEHGLNLADLEIAADLKVIEFWVSDLDLDIRIAADIGNDTGQALAGKDQHTLTPSQLTCRFGRS